MRKYVGVRRSQAPSSADEDELYPSSSSYTALFGLLSGINCGWMALHSNICSPDVHDSLPIQIKCRDRGSANSSEAHNL
jgi:hypothetical protein